MTLRTNQIDGSDQDSKLAKSHRYPFFITSYKILRCFYDEENKVVNRSQAYWLYSAIGKRSKRTFYDHVDWLVNNGFLVYSHGYSPAYYYTTKEQLTRLQTIFLALKPSKGPTLPRTLHQNPPNSSPAPQFSSPSVANSTDFLPDLQILFSQHPLHQILHNFNVKIPLESPLSCFDFLGAVSSLFLPVAQSINLRRYHARLSRTSAHGSWSALITVFRHSILIKLYEVHALDLDIALNEASDRVLELIRDLEQLLLPARLNPMEMSHWRFPTRSGSTYGLENEFAHHPINELLEKRISFTGVKNEFFDVDNAGTKIGFDTSPRRNAEGVLEKEVHFEVKGPEAVSFSNFLKDDMIYQWKSKNDNRTLNEKIEHLTDGHVNFQADVTYETSELRTDLTSVSQTVDTLEQHIGKVAEVLEEAESDIGSYAKTVNHSLASLTRELRVLKGVSDIHADALLKVPEERKVFEDEVTGVMKLFEETLIDVMKVVYAPKNSLFGKFKSKLRGIF